MRRRSCPSPSPARLLSASSVSRRAPKLPRRRAAPRCWPHGACLLWGSTSRREPNCLRRWTRPGGYRFRAPRLLAARHQLARVLDKRGKHEQAETELTNVLDARRRVLGDDDPSTLATRNQRAWTLHALGRDNDAEPSCCTVLAARLRILGDEDPDTLVTRMDLAEVWHAQGRLQDAETGYRTVLEARRRILREDHPKVLNTRADLARLWHGAGRRLTGATRPSSGPTHGRGACRPICLIERSDRRRHRPHRRSTVVRRGSDPLALGTRRAGRYSGDPPTLQQSLMARIDRLGPAREVAQIGSVIGRDFSYGLLRALTDMEDVPLQSALEKLAEADILLVQGLAAGLRISLQARAHSGRGLREFAQEPAPVVAPSRW